jgi:hypothetical protein
MRARAAVIPTLGTTGILLAASLLMLALVSALVAFRGWPGGTGDSVASVPVDAGTHAPVALAQVRRVTLPKAGLTRVVRSAPAPKPVSAAGLVKVEQAEPAPANIVKVPPGVHMSLPPAGVPTVRPAPTTPASEAPHIPPDQPPHVIPQPDFPPGGPADQLQETVGQVVGPLPQLGGGDGDAGGPPVTVTQGEGGGALSVGILGTDVSLPLPR